MANKCAPEINFVCPGTWTKIQKLPELHFAYGGGFASLADYIQTLHQLEGYKIYFLVTFSIVE